MLSYEVRQRVLSSFPHYGHSGIVESARELCYQIDGKPSQEGQVFRFIINLSLSVDYFESFKKNFVGCIKIVLLLLYI